MANAKVKYILELENKMQLDGIVKKVQEAANGFDGLKSKIEISARSLGLMQRELNTMQATFNANSARIKELQQALNLASVSATQDEKANAKLRTELERLTATNDKLSVSMERKSISIQRSSANLAELGRKAGETGRILEKVDTTTAKQGSTLAGLGDQIKGLAGAYLGLEAVTQAAAFAFEGFKLGAGIEQSRLMVQTLVQDVAKGNAIFDEAIKFGQKYGYTQEEMAIAASQAATIINKTNQSTEKSLEVLGRLASLNPAEGFEGAVIAFKELASGDITSIAERFNIARSEANAMKDAIAAGADPVQVLDQALAKMGVTVDVLANRMEGRNGALLDMKLSMESLSLATGDLLDALGAPGLLERFASGVGFLAQGIQYVTGDTEALTNALIDLQVRGFALGDYDLYVQKMTEAGLADEMLSREAYNAANAMISKGTAARDASAGITSLADAEAVLRDMLFQQVQAGELSEEQLNTLVQRTLELAATNPTVSASLLDMVTAMSDSREGADELTQYLDALSINQEFAASTAYGYADAQQAAYDATVQATDANDVHTASVYNMTDADFQSIEAKLLQQIETENAAQFERDLALAYDMAGNGAMGAAAASLFLADRYNLEASETARLIALHNELTKARGGGMGNAAAGALASTLNRMQQPSSVGRSGSGSARRSGGGGSKGKSESAKAAEKEQKDLAKAEKSIEQARQNHNKKLEDLDRKHSAELIKINADYIQKALAAEQKFNTDKFALRNSFEQTLFGIDRDLYDAARAEEVKYWDESQAIAQAGDATKAAELYAAGQELAQMRADHAQQLRDIDAEIVNAESEADAAKLADRKLRMEEAYAEEQRLAEENIAKIRSGEDTLKSERDQAIADENADYAKARTEAEQQFADSLQKIIDGYDAVDEATTRTKDAIVDMVNTLVPEFARLAGAASAVPSGAPASVEAAAGRAVGGNVRAGYAYDVGEFGRERFVPGVSGTILNQRQIDRAMGRTVAPTLATPRQSSGRSETINREEVVLNVTGTAREITQAEATIERIAQRVYNRNAKVTVNRVVTRKLR